MTSRSFLLSDRLYEYYQSVALHEPQVLKDLRAATASEPMARMQLAPEQGQLLRLLTALIGARKCLEVGVYTGYSSTCIALALPEEGRLIACDISAEWTAVAREFWEKAGVAHKIELKLAPAVQTLDRLLDAGHRGSFDLAFIDADKTNYWNYFERALQLTRRGGLVAIDNTLWQGRVADPGDASEGTRAVREFNARIAGDERVVISLLPIGDGLTLALKR